MTDTVLTGGWLDANQRYLAARVAAMRDGLARHIAPHAASGQADPGRRAVEIREAMAAPPALERIAQAFGLSRFENDVLLLCASVELDSAVAALCRTAAGGTSAGAPTFSLALAALEGPHWSALDPDAPLRRWRLIEVGAGHALTTAPLRIDERMLHYLAGVDSIDERLAAVATPFTASGHPITGPDGVAVQVAGLWSAGDNDAVPPLVDLCGDDPVRKQGIALTAAAALGRPISRLRAAAIPMAAAELDALARLWDREARLTGRVLFVESDDADGPEPAQVASVARFVDRVSGLVILSSRDHRLRLTRSVVAIDVPRPSADEQCAAWREALGVDAPALNGHVETLVSHFTLSSTAIMSACAEGIAASPAGPGRGDELRRHIWHACRKQSRLRLEGLATRVPAAATWRELALPDAPLQLLRDIVAHVRQRYRVYEDWGFRARQSRGAGIAVLFAGASGTGKTMAAEVLANDLELDLYRIDLSQVVNKYIGETEKNLRRIFDAAEAGGAILLFDEADALFGKRSDVKDSHDRYANLEVSYLLQRMETYSGLAILTTNMKDALDQAFMRRLRFVVQFPFPDAAQRAEIWRRIFPLATPTAALDIDALARLSVAGGSIRNIALGAAFYAAELNEPVAMPHLLRAARAEYAKLQRPLTPAEIAGWP